MAKIVSYTCKGGPSASGCGVGSSTAVLSTTVPPERNRHDPLASWARRPVSKMNSRPPTVAVTRCQSPWLLLVVVVLILLLLLLLAVVVAPLLSLLLPVVNCLSTATATLCPATTCNQLEGASDAFPDKWQLHLALLPYVPPLLSGYLHVRGAYLMREPSMLTEARQGSTW